MKLPDGCEIRLGDLFIEIVVKELGAVLSRNVIAHIVPKLRNIRALDMAITCYQNGFNPILAFDGDQVFVTRDFLVSYDLCDGMPKAHVYLPLLPALRSIMKSSFAGNPATRPAPKVWTRQGNDTVETEFLPLSDGLCEMQRWTDKVIEHSEDPEQK